MAPGGAVHPDEAPSSKPGLVTSCAVAAQTGNATGLLMTMETGAEVDVLPLVSVALAVIW